MQGHVWGSNRSGRDQERLVSLLSVADSWLKQLRVQHHDFNYFTGIRRGWAKTTTHKNHDFTYTPNNPHPPPSHTKKKKRRKNGFENAETFLCAFSAFGFVFFFLGWFWETALKKKWERCWGLDLLIGCIWVAEIDWSGNRAVRSGPPFNCFFAGLICTSKFSCSCMHLWWSLLLSSFEFWDKKSNCWCNAFTLKSQELWSLVLFLFRWFNVACK